MRAIVNELDGSIRLDGPEIGEGHGEPGRAVVGVNAVAQTCRSFILTAPFERGEGGGQCQSIFYIQHEDSDDQ